MSAKQIATLFGQSFYCFNLEEICKKITDQCLHCASNFYRNRSTKALGETRMLSDIWTPNICWTFDSMHLPPSQGYTHILVGVEAISSYIVLYPMRGVNVDQVIKCMHLHLTVFPHFRIARTDHGPEFGKKFTQYLSTHSIFHAWSIPSRSQVCGQAEISIRITRTMINKIVDSSALNRNQWLKLLPFISNSLNKGQLSAAKGLTRGQLLFSPFIQQLLKLENFT